jgi:hypothetical protein
MSYKNIEMEDELYEVSVRAWRFFKKEGISTLDELTNWYNNTDKYNTPKGMGLKTYREIEDALILNKKITPPTPKPLGTKKPKYFYQIVDGSGVPVNGVIYKQKLETKEPIETLKENYGGWFEAKRLILE